MGGDKSFNFGNVGGDVNASETNNTATGGSTIDNSKVEKEKEDGVLKLFKAVRKFVPWLN